METQQANRRAFLKTVAGGLAMGTIAGVLKTAASASAASTASSAPSVSSLSNVSSAAGARRPNIVLIMADDMGFSDAGCYGSEIETPNLDRLAASGLRFSQFYNCARCCPTRASLLTGLYPHQAGVGAMTGHTDLPGYQGYLNDRCVTIAEALKPAGYSVLMAGKWHVGEQRPHWPVDRGFDEYFGLISGASNYFRIEGRRQLALNDQPYKPEGDSFYITDAFTDHTVQFLDKYGHKDKPFFLYLAFTSPHWPLQAPQENIAKFRGKYMDGPDAIRERRYRRQLEMGLIDKNWKMSPRDAPALKWDQLSEADKKNMDLRMAVYAAQINRMDQNIGRVIDKIRELGAEENTLVMFLCDNGGCAEGGPHGFDRGEKGVEIGLPDSYSSYSLTWANVSDTPFRYYKHYTHEGGISTPLIVRWPAVIKKGGAITHQPGHLIDLMATCVDVVGAQYPKQSKGKDIIPLEGKTLLPVFEGRARQPHETLCWEHYGNRAIHQGKWKLVSRSSTEWELYDMGADRTELNNLAAKMPDKAKELSDAWDAWAKRANVVPRPPRKPRASSKRAPNKKTRKEVDEDLPE